MIEITLRLLEFFLSHFSNIALRSVKCGKNYDQTIIGKTYSDRKIKKKLGCILQFFRKIAIKKLRLNFFAKFEAI